MTTLPNLPVIGEAPWYKKRQAFDEALGALAVDTHARLKTVETIGGLSPGDISDATLTNITLQIESSFYSALSNVISSMVDMAVDEKRIYVSPRGSNSKSGLSPKTAKKTIAGALAAGATYIVCGAGVITDPEPLIIPAFTKIKGAGKRLTTLNRSHTGTWGTAGSRVQFEDLTIDGGSVSDGATGVSFIGTNGQQDMLNVTVSNFDGPCLSFETQSGSQFKAVNLDAYRFNAPTASGRFAIVISDGVVVGATPRMFVNLQTQGTPAISFGACDNVYITTSTLGDLRYTPNSRAVNITGSRILNQMSLVIEGHNNSIVSCDVNPEITIAPGTDACAIGPGSFNRLPIIDNSGNARNTVIHWMRPHTTAISSNGTQPDLKDGYLRAYYSRTGATISIEYGLTMGELTTLGSGYLQFDIPSVGTVIDSLRTVPIGQAVMVSNGVTRVATVQRHVHNKVRLIDNMTGNLVTSEQPFNLALGDTIRFSATYIV